MNRSLVVALAACLVLNVYINHQLRLRSAVKGLTAVERAELKQS